VLCVIIIIIIIIIIVPSAVQFINVQA